MGSEPRYTQEQVSAILRRALQRKEVVDGLTHRELIETAKEVGIAPSEVEAAIEAERREAELRAEREEWLEERRVRLRGAAITWALVSALCFVVNWFLGPPWWSAAVTLPWLMLLVLKGLRLQGGPTRAQLERRRLRRLQAQRRAEMRAKIETGAQVLGDVVEQGVSALIEHLEERRRRELPPDGKQRR